jgi:hypothetical protein
MTCLEELPPLRVKPHMMLLDYLRTWGDNFGTLTARPRLFWRQRLLDMCVPC